MSRHQQLNVTSEEKANLLDFFTKMKSDFDTKAETSFIASIPKSILSHYFIALSNIITRQALVECKAANDMTKLFQYQIDIAGELEVTGEASDAESYGGVSS